MDYTSQPLWFKLRKTIRYACIYGARRTLIKVRGQYHMKRTYERLPEVREVSKPGQHVGLIGCGNFAFSCIAYYLQKNYGNIIKGAMDINSHRAASLYEYYGLSYYSSESDRIIEDPDIDLIYIASNHASHAEYAIRALDTGKSVHIEKPHVVTEDQLVRLCAAMNRSAGQVSLGFNRPWSYLGLEIKKWLSSQTGAAVYNWFVAGHEIPPEHWYFKDEEGGRVLGNLCHWTDFVYQLVAPESRFPIQIIPTRHEKSDCDIAVTYIFGDGTIAAITFSAKGHAFEGVRERFSAHRGNVLLAMEDFKTLTVDYVDSKRKYSRLFRDHGHERAIKSSYATVRPVGGAKKGVNVDYVWETGQLFLKTKESLDSNRTITLYPYNSLENHQDETGSVEHSYWRAKSY